MKATRRTPAREITDRTYSTSVEIRGRLVERGDELTINGIRGRCAFVRHVRHVEGHEWIDVTTARGFSRTVHVEAVRTVHRSRRSGLAAAS